MADCPNYGCSDLVAYDAGDPCLTYKGGSNKAVLFKCGLDIDVTDGVAVQAAITSGDAVLLENLKINWDEPSAVTVDPLIGCLTEAVAAYDHSIAFIDRNVQAASIDFYNSASSGYTFGEMLVWECDAQRVTHIDVALQLIGGRVFPDQNNAFQHFSFNVTARSAYGSFPIVATPADIFN
jgi:hypothetical protein